MNIGSLASAHNAWPRLELKRQALGAMVIICRANPMVEDRNRLGYVEDGLMSEEGESGRG